MLRLITLLFVVSIVSLGAGWLLDHDGTVGITWQGWRVETSVSYALLVLGVLFVVLAATLMLLTGLRRLPQRLTAKRETRHHAQALTALTHAWIAAAEGDGKQLKHHTAKARKRLGDAPTVLLLELEQARQEGSRARLHTAMKKLSERPETRYIGLRAALEQARRENDPAAALVLARDARSLRPDLPQAATELLTLLKQQRQYDEALLLLEKHGNAWPFKHRSAENKRERALLYLMRARRTDEEGEHEKALESAATAYDLLPSFAPVAAQYAALLERQGKKRKASSIRKKPGYAARHKTWVCGRCGHREPQWNYFCAQCGAVDAFKGDAAATAALPAS